MLFAAICLDKPASLETRLANRSEHLAYLDAHKALVKLAGPFLDDAQQPVGSLLLLDCVDEAAARAFLDGDPYARAGLFSSVELRLFKRVLGAEL